MGVKADALWVLRRIMGNTKWLLICFDSPNGIWFLELEGMPIPPPTKKINKKGRFNCFSVSFV